MPNKKVKPKVLNIGWIGQGDFGDEVMAYAMRRYLRERGIGDITYYQQGKFADYIGDPDIEVAKLHSFDVRPKVRRLLDLIKLRKFNTLLVGGGSLFHSENSIEWKHEVVKRMKKNCGKDLVVGLVGVGVGPFRSDEAKQKCSSLFSDVDMLITRDMVSADISSEIAPELDIRSSCDTSFLLPLISKDKMGLPKGKEKDQNRVGLLFIHKKSDDEIFQEGKHEEKFQKIVDDLLSREKKVKLFTFYVGDSYLDIALNERLKRNSINPEKVEIYEYTGDIFETIQEMNTCSQIVSMRLHGIILSYMLGIPFVSLSYDPKNENFCRTVNYPLEYAFDFYREKDFDKIMNQIKTLTEGSGDEFANSKPVNEVSRMVEKNINDLLDKVCRK